MTTFTQSANAYTVVQTLRNGVTVALERLPYLRSIAAGVWINAGSACETPAQTGVSHFLEHLFFKGTKARTARQLIEAVESRGGHLNAFTSRDHTCVYIKTLDAHTLDAIEILGDIIKNSQFFDFEKERGIILEEIASAEDVPEDYVHDVFCERLWPDHALGRPITGTEESVSGLSIEDVRAYFQSWYVPENIIVSIAGNFEIEPALDAIAREFEGIAARPSPPAPGRPVFGACLDRVIRPIGQHHVCFGFPGPDSRDPRRFAYDVLSNVVGGGSTSRLFEEIREQAGLAYSIYSFHYCYRPAGTLGVYAAVAPENLTQTIDLACRELRKMREEPVPESELAMNREMLKANLLMGLESTFNRMARQAKSLMIHGRIVPQDEVVEKIEAVSVEDVQRLAHEIFVSEQCAAVILGPEDAERMKAFPL